MLIPDSVDLDEPRQVIIDKLVADGGYDRPAAEAVAAALLEDEDVEPLE